MVKAVLFLIVVTLALLSVSTALAEGNVPVGGCPKGFHLHHEMDMDDHDEHMHQHIGIKADLNGDDYLCVLHTTESLHVHIDNFIR